MTTVTAKFYRSQSDSSRPPSQRHLTKTLSKPASLGNLNWSFKLTIGLQENINLIFSPIIPTEHPSSSSLSTTTSSVTSMTSLEHESNETTSVSASDYGNEYWDNENWGDMDVSEIKLSFPPINRKIETNKKLFVSDITRS